MPEAVAAPIAEELLFPAISETLIGGGVESASAGFAAGASPFADVALSGGISEVAADTAAKAGAAAAEGAGAAGGAKSVIENLKTAATVLSPIASIASAASGLKAASSLRTPSGSGATAPGGLLNSPAPVAMPSLGGPNTIQAQRASLQSQLYRRGRASTILTTPDGERLGS